MRYVLKKRGSHPKPYLRLRGSSSPVTIEWTDNVRIATKIDRERMAKSLTRHIFRMTEALCDVVEYKKGAAFSDYERAMRII